MASDAPIEGFVPLPAPAGDAAPARKKPGPRKGWRKSPAASRDPSDPGQYVKPTAAPGKAERCPVCERATAALSLDMVRELVQAAADRLDVLGERGAEVAASDVRYLAARLNGLCSLSCSRARTDA